VDNLDLNVKLKKYEKAIHVFKIALDLARRLRDFRCELDSLIHAISGGFVEPGPSGSLTRGKFEILPTGRNFYTIDPRTIPTQSAWEIGVKCGKALLEKYYSKYGRYPESVGFVLWSIDAYKADGEELSEILYLIGVRPVWDSYGNVVGLEPIPLEELGRPRIDVTVRISGIVRDTLPNYIYLIDRAIEIVLNLDEPIDMNFIKKHYLEFLERLKMFNINDEELAKCRIFAEPPGAYGAGVNYAVESSAWRSREDLGKVWISWSGYAYTRKSFGKPAHEALILNLEKVDAVVRNNPTDEHDIFSCCCYFAYHGGFYTAVKTVKRGEVEIYQIDTSDISKIDVRDIEDEIERIVRAKLLNDKWIEEMKKHGYSGASEFSRKILHLYGWASTTGKVKDWIFNEISNKYVINDEMRRWFIENNKYALEEITRRLIEAAERGVWNPDPEILDKLKSIYLEIEGYLEDEVVGEVQGGSIDIVSPEDYDDYKKLVSKSEKAMNIVEKTQ